MFTRLKAFTRIINKPIIVFTSSFYSSQDSLHKIVFILNMQGLARFSFSEKQKIWTDFCVFGLVFNSGFGFSV